MSKRKLRRRVKLLEAVCEELIGRVEQLESGEPEQPKWRDSYGPALDMDPAPPISDELTFEAPSSYLGEDDGDDWRRGTYI